MAAMSAAAMSSLSGSAMATLSCSSVTFGSSGALRSPATLGASRILAVRASHTSEEHSPSKSKARIALVAAGAAIALIISPIPNSSGSAIALDLNSLIDNVKELSSNIPSSEGEGGTPTELAKQAAQRVATNAARDFTSGDADSKTSRLLDSVKELAGNKDAKNAAIDIAKNAASKNSSSSEGNTASNVLEAIKSLPGSDGENGVQNAAVDAAKGAASNAARDFANNAKNRIGAEAGKALFNSFKGNDN